jgi:hypothetical protein
MKFHKLLSVFGFVSLVSLTACKESPKTDKKGTSAEPPAKNYSEIGSNYAKSTQAELGKNLVGAIQKSGTLGALEFCNVQAYPLTDSMAAVHNAGIHRVSDKPRNPDNRANGKELAHIKYFKNKIASGEEYKPIVENEHGIITFYAPITTNAMCLQCHGKPNEQITPETLMMLQELYPDDKAIGYGENEVRGIWSIAFEE